MRNFRLGEWLPEAMTPLFTDWLLERLEHGYLQATRHHTGAALIFPHATINGWYYTANPARHRPACWWPWSAAAGGLPDEGM